MNQAPSLTEARIPDQSIHKLPGLHQIKAGLLTKMLDCLYDLPFLLHLFQFLL